MPDLRFKPEPAQHTEIPRPKRAEGQWALGYTEPLNKNEQSKKDDDPLNVRNRILYTYSKRGFDSIDPADLRGRFRWMGLYTQRAPGFDGGKTATLEEEELDDRFFMMRVRTDGQILGAEQLRALGETSTTYARNTADITDRNNIQYHWIDVVDVPAIWERLEGAGLTTVEACGDSPRPFLGSPVAGIAKDEIIDGSEALAEIKRRGTQQPRVLQPAAQVQDRPDRPPQPRRGARGQRRLLRRHRPPRARPRFRRVGRWWSLDQPDARAEARRSGSRSTRSRTSGRAWPASSATTATAVCAARPV